MKKAILPKIGCIIIILWTGADGGFHLFYFTPLTIFDGVISPQHQVSLPFPVLLSMVISLPRSYFSHMVFN